MSEQYKTSVDTAERTVRLLNALIDAPNEVSDTAYYRDNRVMRTISRLEGSDCQSLNWPFSKTEVSIAYENHHRKRYETFALQLSWLITRPGEAGRPYVKKYVIDVLPGGEVQSLMTLPLVVPELTESPDGRMTDRAEERPMTPEDFVLLADELDAMHRYVQGSVANDWPAAEDYVQGGN